jgi:hypothetical protein
MSADQKDKRLKEFLENGKDWERKQTNIPGVFLIRLPQFRSRPACIGIELDMFNRGGGVIGEEGSYLELVRNYSNSWAWLPIRN